ncbi:uncharacterized protein SCDLUD_001424 [Saccharomycodes ludwigii]|uniref:uncharacterized protein n=1 Tax=Saccharomycodes ludwigii TaxID=36035 RepID=UPI001E89FE24|nr:hypothetical protein SCDLUD_001424 [Saccharomycodes ludwigii]KAH3901655.1 hypothetical protein SCDLUD_001424 [Saccharomycodes ludwigii]
MQVGNEKTNSTNKIFSEREEKEDITGETGEILNPTNSPTSSSNTPKNNESWQIISLFLGNSGNKNNESNTGDITASSDNNNSNSDDFSIRQRTIHTPAANGSCDDDILSLSSDASEVLDEDDDSNIKKNKCFTLAEIINCLGKNSIMKCTKVITKYMYNIKQILLTWIENSTNNRYIRITYSGPTHSTVNAGSDNNAENNESLISLTVSVPFLKKVAYALSALFICSAIVYCKWDYISDKLIFYGYPTINSGAIAGSGKNPLVSTDIDSCVTTDGEKLPPLLIPVSIPLPNPRQLDPRVLYQRFTRMFDPVNLDNCYSTIKNGISNGAHKTFDFCKTNTNNLGDSLHDLNDQVSKNVHSAKHYIDSLINSFD